MAARTRKEDRRLLGERHGRRGPRCATAIGTLVLDARRDGSDEVKVIRFPRLSALEKVIVEHPQRRCAAIAGYDARKRH